MPIPCRSARRTAGAAGRFHRSRRQAYGPGRRRPGGHGGRVGHGPANPPRKAAPSAADFLLDRAGRIGPARGPICRTGSPGQAAIGFQLRRRRDQKGHHRRDRRLSHGDPDRWHRQPCRRRRRRRGSVRSSSPRWRSPNCKMPAGTAGSRRTAIAAPATSGCFTAATPRTWSPRGWKFAAEARSHEPAFRRKIVKAIERAFHDAARRVRNEGGSCGKVRIEGRLDYEAFVLPGDDPSVLAAEAAISATGGHPSRSISNGGLDANWTSVRHPHRHSGVWAGNPHPVEERLDLPQFRQACRIACGWPAGGEMASSERNLLRSLVFFRQRSEFRSTKSTLRFSWRSPAALEKGWKNRYYE